MSTALASNREGWEGLSYTFECELYPPKLRFFPPFLQLTDNRRFARVVYLFSLAGLTPSRFSKRDPESIPTCWMKKGAASLGHHLDRCAFSFWRNVFFENFSEREIWRESLIFRSENFTSEDVEWICFDESFVKVSKRNFGWTGKKNSRFPSK